MASAYPGGLDSLATNKTNSTPTVDDHAGHHNDLADAVNKIEGELGTNPSAGFATVAARLDTFGAGGAGTPIHSSLYEERALAGSIVEGATQITLDTAFTNATLGNGCVAIDPGTVNCEVRRVTAGSGTTTLTLQGQRSYGPGKTRFLATGRRIRWASQISSISVSGNVLTIVLDQTTGLAQGDRVQIWGTTNYNRRYHVPVRSVSGDGLTITLDWFESAPATENTGWVSRYSHRWFSKHFKVGQKFVVASSTSNNGTFTVESVDSAGGYITTVESLTNEFTENATFTWNIRTSHSAGTKVLYIPDRQISYNLYAIKADNSTDNTTAFQNACWDVGTIAGRLYGEQGVGYIRLNDRIGIPACQVEDFKLNFQGTPDFSDRSLGNLTNVSTFGLWGSVGRLYLKNIFVEGKQGQTANNLGILINTQQPNTWYKVRIDNCWENLLIRGQQGAFYTLEMIGGNYGMTWEEAKFFRFFDFDSEQQTGASIYSPKYGGGGNTNAIFGGHCENTAGGHFLDDEHGMLNCTFDSVEVSAVANAKIIWVHPIETAKREISYRLSNFWINSTEDIDMIDDVPGNIQLHAYDWFRQHVNEFVRVAQPQNQTARDATGWMICGPQGQRTAFGPDLTGSPVMTMRQLDANAGHFLRLDTDGTADLARITKAGEAQFPSYRVGTTARILTGSGTPEASVTAPVGSIYLRTGGGTGTTVYIKETGAGNTGWVAIAAGGGGGGDPVYGLATPPNWVSGSYYGTYGVYGENSGGLLTQAALRGVPFDVGVALNVDRIGLNCFGAGTAGSVTRLGIYQDNGVGPHTLVLDAGTVDTSTTGRKEITISQALSAATRYWLVAVGQGSPGTQPNMSRIAATVPTMGLPQGWNSNYTSRIKGFERASISGALPSTLTPTRADFENSQDMPMIMVRAV